MLKEMKEFLINHNWIPDEDQKFVVPEGVASLIHDISQCVLGLTMTMQH